MYIYINSYITSNIFGYSKPIFHLAMLGYVFSMTHAIHRQEKNVCVR